MQHRTLAKASLDVSCLGLGTLPLATHGRPDADEAAAVVHAALDAGITLLDTADSFAQSNDDVGYAERLIRRVLAERADGSDIVVATKGGLVHEGGTVRPDGRPEHLRAACERSLRALGGETIDLYLLHAPDFAVPWADSVGALWDLREQGKVRAIGLCNVSLKEIDQAREVTDIAVVCNRMGAHDLSSWVSGVVQGCVERDIAFFAHTPLGGPRQVDAIAENPYLGEIARGLDATPHEVALAWLLSKPVVPLVGASRIQTAQSSARAAALELREADIKALDAALGQVYETA